MTISTKLGELASELNLILNENDKLKKTINHLETREHNEIIKLGNSIHKNEFNMRENQSKYINQLLSKLEIQAKELIKAHTTIAEQYLEIQKLKG